MSVVSQHRIDALRIETQLRKYGIRALDIATRRRTAEDVCTEYGTTNPDTLSDLWAAHVARECSGNVRGYVEQLDENTFLYVTIY